MATLGDCLAYFARGMLLQDRECGVVHEDDHGGRAARSRELLDNFGGITQRFAAATDVSAADEAQDARFAERLDVLGRKRARLVHLLGGRGDDVSDEAVQRLAVVR